MNTETMDFKQKVQSMSAEEIIMSMVNGIQTPVIMLDMDSYGHTKDGICFGCAATNAVCLISGKVFNSSGINNRADFLQTDAQFLNHFEHAIDDLRSGNVWGYNKLARSQNFAEIKTIDIFLPWLAGDITEDELQPYIDLANAQN